jgi:hypothetical protein
MHNSIVSMSSSNTIAIVLNQHNSTITSSEFHTLPFDDAALLQAVATIIAVFLFS